MVKGKELNQEKKHVSFELLVTTADDGKAGSEKVSATVSTRGKVRALDFITCASIIVNSLQDTMNLDDDTIYKAIAIRANELSQLENQQDE